jgi:hypothetical protein
MTTLRQKLVRKKNPQAAAAARAAIRSINIKLFYARDFRALMLKYGKVALVEGLSGSSGQVALPHAGAAGSATQTVGPQTVGAQAVDAPPPAASPIAATVLGTGRRRAARVPASSTVEPETGAR